MPGPLRSNKVLSRLVFEGTVRSTGEVFFASLVKHPSSTIGVGYAFVAEFDGTASLVRNPACRDRGEIPQKMEFDLAGIPLEDVVLGGGRHHPLGVQETFPLDQGLIELKDRELPRRPVIRWRGHDPRTLAEMLHHPVP